MILPDRSLSLPAWSERLSTRWASSTVAVMPSGFSSCWPADPRHQSSCPALAAWARRQHRDDLPTPTPAPRLGATFPPPTAPTPGTGGGNHLTLGGPTPADSPLLRRPDLLAQHHHVLAAPPVALVPVLAGGSSARRARRPGSTRPATRASTSSRSRSPSSSASPAPSGQPPPWLVDRLLRHLLVDITGNTHRAEFCIDKLFSPDAERGRLGLLELRGFEMPPHPRMALVQALLVRALVARFWAEPYTGALVRWGTELHDRFLLPPGGSRTTSASRRRSRRHGYRVRAGVARRRSSSSASRDSAPCQVGGVTLELRTAIEPWHVLGEEIGAPRHRALRRLVLERLQVHGRRPDAEPRTSSPATAAACRCIRRAPPATHVAGVRYRAWQPPSALHPTIGVHVPLVFDLVDRWSGRSLGGCTYHVGHPGGRAYERFPVNANEAEARRRQPVRRRRPHAGAG